MSNSVLTELKQVTKGLLYISEIDAPWKTCTWKEPGALTRKKVLELTSHPTDSKVQIPDFDSFFTDLVVERKWHGEEEKALVRKYQALVKVLKDNLTQLKVFKIGASKMKVYIVGKSTDGTWVGLETEAMET